MSIRRGDIIASLRDVADRPCVEVQTLHPALDAELRSLDWSAWAAELDRGVQYDPEEAQSVLDAHTRWKTRRDEDRVLRQATGTASAA